MAYLAILSFTSGQYAKDKGSSAKSGSSRLSKNN